MPEDDAQYAVPAVRPPRERPDPVQPAANDGRPPDELDEPDQIALRFDQILRTHREDPARLPNEGRYARLARQLMEERQRLAAEIADANLPKEEARAEFERRAQMLDRFAAAWTPDDPLSARPRATTEPGRHLAFRADAPLANDLGWTPLLALPGYAEAGMLGRAIRALGDATFRSFPCYAAMIKAAEEHDLDPLGQVQVLSSLSERQHGVVRERIEELGQFAFPIRRERMRDLNRLPGYQPEIKICFSEEHSFLTVRERRAAGAPIDADYIYSWIGGIFFYRDQPEQIAILRNVLDLGEHALLPAPTAKTAPRMGM